MRNHAGMMKTPPLALQYRNVLLALIDAIEAERGFSDASLSRSIFTKPDGSLGHADGIKAIRRWDGATRSPNLNTAVRVEDFIRTNLRDDPVESETRYREVVRSSLAEVLAGYAPQITHVDEAA